MANIRRSPSTDIMRPFFDTFFERMGGPLRMPETDVTETENEIRVSMDLPGMQAEDIDVELENNVLTISGRRAETKEDNEGRFQLAERRWGEFSRSFVLPREVEGDEINAQYKDGVLTVSIPKSESARRRRISVGQSEQGGTQVSSRTSTRGGSSASRGGTSTVRTGASEQNTTA